MEHRTIRFRTLDDSITLKDVGYTEYKLTRLHGQYFVQEAVNTAMELHAHNVKRRKYASSAFHCYNHLLKTTFEGKSRHGSIMGPCIQSVVLTLRPHERRTAVDVFYRTTEIFKKFPADLIWLYRNILPLIPHQDQYPVVGITFHFVNVTVHPMFLGTILPHLPDPVATLLFIKYRDADFYHKSGNWLMNYLGGPAAGQPIAKFAQGQRAAKAVRASINGEVHRSIVGHLYRNAGKFLPTKTKFDLDDMKASIREEWEALDCPT